MRILIILCLLLSVSLSCSDKNQKNKELANFSKWVLNKEYKFQEYLVLNFNACHACHDHMIKLIKDNYLSLNTNTAIVLIVRQKSDLAPIKEHIELDNLLIYNEGDPPIINNLPRLYISHSKDQFTYKSFNIHEFDVKIEEMSNHAITHKQLQNTSISNLKGIYIPGNSDFMVINSAGNIFKVEQDDFIK